MNLNGIFDEVIGKLESWVEALILLLPNIVGAVVVVVVFALLARLVRRGVVRLMGRVSPYTQVNNLLATLAYVGVLAVGLFVALGILGLSKTVTTLLAGAGVIGLALGFAFQDIAANFISGVLLSIRRPFTEGDVLETNDFTGIVEKINLRSTLIRTFQGQIVIIPNKEVFQNPMVNFSRLGRRRVDVSCGVAYGDDLEKAKTLALGAIREIDYRDTAQDPDLYYTEFGDSSINFTVRFWVDFKKQTDFLCAQSDAIMNVKKAFDENGITIPFPIRTLDFGVVGGEKLNEVLPPSLYKENGGGSASAQKSEGRPDAAPHDADRS